MNVEASPSSRSVERIHRLILLLKPLGSRGLVESLKDERRRARIEGVSSSSEKNGGQEQRRPFRPSLPMMACDFHHHTRGLSGTAWTSTLRCFRSLARHLSSNLVAEVAPLISLPSTATFCPCCRSLIETEAL